MIYGKDLGKKFIQEVKEILGLKVIQGRKGFRGERDLGEKGI